MKSHVKIQKKQSGQNLRQVLKQRAAFKEFYRNFRLTEKSSIQEAEEYALQTLKSGVVPEYDAHWRGGLELADLAKRSNKFEEARRFVCTSM
jgi:hypothetical protein